jgi:chromosome segregation ATPase
MTTDSNKASQDAKGDSPDNTGTSAKTVSESDLIALKRTHETELIKLRGHVSTLEQEVASERTARQAVEAKATELDEVTEKVTGLETQLSTATEQVTKLTEANLSSRKQFLQTSHGLKEDQLKDLDEPQLKALEDILPSVTKTVPSAANLDITAPAAMQNGATLTSREKIRQGID